MTNRSGAPALSLPERSIRAPVSVSPEALASFTSGFPSAPPYPPRNQAEAWRAYAAAMDAATLPFLNAGAAASTVNVEEKRVGMGRAYLVTPASLRAPENFILLDIHGGALIMGGGECCRAAAVGVATKRACRVLSVDYRMPPDHPFPAALDDCLAAYRTLLVTHKPSEIVIQGGSAGANLAAAMILRARDERLPLPAAVVLLTPEVDLTESGDSFQTNLGLDAVLTQSLMPANELYAAGHDLQHPYLSPLFGDFSRGFPPTLLTAGTRDLFLSNAVRMHWALRKWHIAAELYLLEAASHGGYFNGPEADLLDAEVERFTHRYWGNGETDA